MGSRTPDFGGGECPHDDEIVSYAEGRLSEEERDRFERHLSDCDLCREGLAVYIRMVATEELDDERAAVDELDRQTAPLVRAHIRRTLAEREARAARTAWRTPWRAVAAAAVLVLVGASAAYWWADRSSDLRRGTAALDAVLAESRPSAFRLANAPYSRFAVARGAAPARAESAEHWLRAAVAERPTPEAKRQLARALLTREDAAGARRLLEEARRQAPADVDVAVDLAVARAETGDPELALADLSAVVRDRPNRADALFDLAIVNARLGRTDEARADWARYLALDPSSPWAADAREYAAALDGR